MNRPVNTHLSSALCQSVAGLDAFTVRHQGGSSAALAGRVRALRRRIGRWIPSASTAAVFASDYPSMVEAAERLNAAVKRLNIKMSDGRSHGTSRAVPSGLPAHDALTIPNPLAAHVDADTLQLVEVEAAANAFERLASGGPLHHTN